MKIHFKHLEDSALQPDMNILDPRVADAIVLNSVKNGVVAKGSGWKLEKCSNYYLFHQNGVTKQGYSLADFNLKEVK